MEAGIYCPPGTTAEHDHVLGLNSDFVKEVFTFFYERQKSLSAKCEWISPLFLVKKQKKTKFTVTDKQKLQNYT